MESRGSYMNKRALKGLMFLGLTGVLCCEPSNSCVDLGYMLGTYAGGYAASELFSDAGQHEVESSGLEITVG